MDSSEAIFDGLKDVGIDFIVSVPCVNLSKLLDMIDEDEEITHIPVTREEEGIGICAGAYLGGKKPAILMQNSGLGNSINALKSLMELYEFPLLMIMSHNQPQEYWKLWTTGFSNLEILTEPMKT